MLTDGLRDPLMPEFLFLLGDYQQALETSAADYGYTSEISLAALGRTSEAATLLREREQTNPPRLGKLYLTSLRALLEGNRAESLEASDELLQATFRDPEGMFYLARQLGYLREEVKALTMLRRAIDHGFLCYASMVRDPWLDSLRGSTEFTELLRKAQGLHRQAVDSFVRLGGNSLLGMHREGY
jgi:hypothetical protein